MIINKLTSTFGDHSSLLPLFTKDVVNSAGMTAFSYDAGGKIEAKDRFIDEFGTQAIWMGGLPFFKYAFDKTAYKLAKINPNIDVRLLKDKDQLAVAQNYAKKIKHSGTLESLTDAMKRSKTAQGLFISKFSTATALTLGAFFTLVKLKQNYTKKQIEKEFWAKKSQEHFYNNNVAKSPAFKSFQSVNGMKAKPAKDYSENKNVSFKGLGSVLSDFMIDPVKNLSLVDLGITGERLVNSRTHTEFAETAIKEGSLLFFLYAAGSYIQKGIEKLSSKMGKPIELHAEVLSSNYLKDSIASGQVHKDVAEITDLLKDKNTRKAFFEFIYDEKNANNTVIKAAKQSGVIKNIVDGTALQKLFKKGKDTGLIDPHQYISASSVEDIAKNLKKIAEMAPKEEKDLAAFLKKCTKFKIGSVAANMGISCLFLGLIVPYSMMKYREKQQNGVKEFHVQTQIQKELERNFKGRIA